MGRLNNTDVSVDATYHGRMGTEYLNYPRVAERTGIKAAVLRQYLARARRNRAAGTPTPGDFPEPDDWYGRSPVWKPATIDRWLKRRPGKGVGGADARERYRAERERGERPAS